MNVEAVFTAADRQMPLHIDPPPCLRFVACILRIKTDNIRLDLSPRPLPVMLGDPFRDRPLERRAHMERSLKAILDSLSLLSAVFYWRRCAHLTARNIASNTIIQKPKDMMKNPR